MNSSHAAVLNTLTKVQRFLDANGNTLGTINQSGYRVILDDVVAKLSSHAANQTTSKRVGAAQTAKERVLRNALKLNNMRPIATVAAAQLSQVPDFLALKMPPKNSTSPSLVAWAALMHKAASDYTDAFIGAGLPPDFLAQLQSASDLLNNAIGTRGATRSVQSGATTGLDAEATRGRQAVKVLDSLVEPLISGDIALLAQWNSAKRFGGKASPISGTSIDAAAKGPATPLAKPTADAAPAPTPALTAPTVPTVPTAPTPAATSAAPTAAAPPPAPEPTQSPAPPTP